MISRPVTSYDGCWLPPPGSQLQHYRSTAQPPAQQQPHPSLAHGPCAGYVPGKKSRGYRPKPRKDIPKIVYGVDGLDPEGGEDGIRYHPDTGHDKHSRFMQHTDCSVKWLCPDPRKHGLANENKNRVYEKEENFCYTEDEAQKKKPMIPHDARNEIQIRFKGNSVRGSNSNGVRVILETEDCERIRSIKERIQDQLLDRDADRDYAPEEQLLFFEDELLEDDKTIGDYGIKMYHTINAEMRCGFGTSRGLFTTVAEYEWNEHRGLFIDSFILKCVLLAVYYYYYHHYNYLFIGYLCTTPGQSISSTV